MTSAARAASAMSPSRPVTTLTRHSRALDDEGGLVGVAAERSQVGRDGVSERTAM